MKNKKMLKTIISIIIILLIINVKTIVFASNLNLNIEFDGKKIEMSSETPEMEWTINSLSTNQKKEAILTINSIGNKEVKAEFNLEIIEGKELEDYIKIKIENKKTGETLFEGKYIELTTTIVKIPAKETNIYKITIEEQEENSKEIQNKKCIIKFKFVAKGTKISLINKQDNTISKEQNAENEAEEITTNIIKPIKTNKSYAIIIVLGTLLVTLAILIAIYLKSKKQ